MPLYEYVCNRCDTRFEMLRPTTRMDDPADCPKDHGTGKRILSNFAALTKDPYGETAPVSGMGGCGGCAGGCTCGAN